MDRFTPEVNKGEPWMEPDPNGEWVRYEDVTTLKGNQIMSPSYEIRVKMWKAAGKVLFEEAAKAFNENPSAENWRALYSAMQIRQWLISESAAEWFKLNTAVTYDAVVNAVEEYLGQ